MAGASVAQETPGDPASFGQTLRVRVVNVKNGRPLENQQNSMIFNPFNGGSFRAIKLSTIYLQPAASQIAPGLI